MEPQLENEIKNKARELIIKSGFLMSAAELDALQVNDLGLGNIRKEGFAFFDILRTPRLRITLLVLLPNQTLPQHMHPPYDNELGKEETMRVIYGQAKVYVPGHKNNDHLLIPEGKEKYYTARHEIVLNPAEQYCVKPNVEHWFQAGDEGVVTLCFQNRVDETKNLFFDPNSTGCLIKPDD